MIDRTILIFARTARYSQADYRMAPRVQMAPAPVICRAKDADTWHVEGSGDVARTRVICDEEVEPAQHRAQAAKRRLPCQIESRPSHACRYGLGNFYLVLPAGEHNLRTKLVDHRVREGGEVFYRPAA